jgi:hypothetical protein
VNSFEFPDQLKIDYLIVKVGKNKHLSYFVHSRIAIRYLGDISKEFRAKVESVFDRYLQGDLNICNETISNRNRRNDVLTSYECDSLAINDLKKPDDAYSLAFKAAEQKGTLLDLRSMQKMQSMMNDMIKHYSSELFNEIKLSTNELEKKIEINSNKIELSTNELEKKVDTSIIIKEQNIQSEIKSRQCLYCMRIHANNSAATNHLNNNCIEKQFSDMKYIIDGHKLLKLVNKLKDQLPKSFTKIVINDTDVENISIVLFIKEKIPKTKKYKGIKKTYSFNSSDKRWKLYDLFAEKFYLKLENVLTESSKKQFKNNEEIRNRYYIQIKENEENEDDVIEISDDEYLEEI